MKRLVDGVELEFPEHDLEVNRLPGRLLVKTAEGAFSALVVRDKAAVLVSFKGRQYRVETVSRKSATATSGAASGELRAPMPGVVVAVNSKIGDLVAKGAVVVVIEAMKTQQPFVAPFDGVVEKVAVEKGQTVTEGTLLAFLKSLTDN